MMEEELLVNSQMIRRIKYFFDTSILEIEYNNGPIWHYYDFPEFLWHDFKNAESKGKFFHNNIKKQYNENQVQ